MTALLLGATGLVGSHALPLLLDHDRWDRVVTLGRRPMPVAGPGHTHHVVDFDRIAEHPDLFRCDDVFCCLGTTIKDAGSEEAFARVDRDYPFAAAQLAHGQGASQYLLISSIGANPKSPFFYARVKGEVEDALKDVGFESLSIFRPSQLSGVRREARSKEKVALGVLKILSPVLVGPLRRYRATPARAVAEAMVQVAAERPAGVHVHEADAIVRRAAV
ncbi:MAG: oxidoreductase [Rubricoccaceae bacterium]|nr:oxidoreductase [Rubricoccaceae bacterium]